MNLFHSARLKLTAFYFAVLLVFCLMLTFGVRAFTNYELYRSDVARSGAVHRLVDRLYNPNPGAHLAPGADGRYFTTAEQQQSDLTRHRLNQDFFVMNLMLLVIGAVLSYWYAGRTLRPIEAAHEQQKRFTSDASHELRTPLTSMKLENELFLRQKNFGETDARQLITSNLEEVQRLERLATNLLSLNKYEQAAIHAQPVPVKELIDSAITIAKRNKATKNTAFKADAAAATIQTDPESLHELLTILFDNAVKYGPPKGPIEITGEQQGGHYLLRIHDHGPGIAGEDLPHIFERMYRGDKARGSKVAGHGIGLSLAQQIAKANGASLTAANHKQGGAVFTLTLPS